MRDGTKALQLFFSDLFTNAQAREKELPHKVREIRDAIADERGYDFDPPTRVAPGSGRRRCSEDETILIDDMGRAVSPISVSLSSPRGPVTVTATLFVWRDNAWMAAIDAGKALDTENEFDALCSQLTQAIQKQLRLKAYDLMKNRGRIDSGGGW